MKALALPTEEEQTIADLDKQIAAWQAKLPGSSAIQAGAFRAVIRHLEHQKRALKKNAVGASLEDRWKDLVDLSLTAYDKYIAALVEAVSRLLDLWETVLQNKTGESISDA